MGNAPEFCSTLGTVDHQTTSGLGWVQQETVSVVQVNTFVKIKISNTQGNRPPFPKKKKKATWFKLFPRKVFKSQKNWSHHWTQQPLIRHLS